jgi:hypothetical protein
MPLQENSRPESHFQGKTRHQPSRQCRAGTAAQGYNYLPDLDIRIMLEQLATNLVIQDNGRTCFIAL